MKKFSANFISVNIFKKDLIYLEFNVIIESAGPNPPLAADVGPAFFLRVVRSKDMVG